jgi:hypothetical protein
VNWQKISLIYLELIYYVIHINQLKILVISNYTILVIYSELFGKKNNKNAGEFIFNAKFIAETAFYQT